MKNLSDKSCRENQNTHFMFKEFFRESCCLRDHVEKYCTAGQATDDNITWSMRISCWITKVRIHTHTHTHMHTHTHAHTHTCTHSHTYNSLFCHGNNSYTNVSQCYTDTYIACHVHYSVFFCPMPPNVLVDFVVFPPGHGRSVTDF